MFCIRHIPCYCLLMLSFVCSAQIRTEGFNIDAGYSISAQSRPFKGRVTRYRNNINAFYIGISHERLMKRLRNSSLSIGIDFTKKGYKNDVTRIYKDTVHTRIHDQWHYALYYAEVPIIIRTSIRRCVNINYGLVPAFLFYDRYQRSLSYSSTVLNFQSNTSRHFGYRRARGYDLQLNLGLSKDITSRISIEANLRRGLINQNRRGLGAIGYQDFFMIGLKYNFKKPKADYVRG